MQLRKAEIEIKCDKDGNLGLSIGKVKFSDKEYLKILKVFMKLFQKKSKLVLKEIL
jgi:large subunit ribosomal protein L1